ncbi:RNA polymerase sigma factor [Planctomycetota bacterium]
MIGKTDTNSNPADTSRFATTHWSIVLAAGNSSSSQHKQALSSLCQTYWFPLYAYLRRQGHDPQKTEDYIQSFLAYIIEKCALGRADRNRGKFRSFLLASLKNFMRNEWDYTHSQKLGGHKRILSLDTMTAETRYGIEPVDRLSPDKLFERSWAVTILQNALDQLKKESTHAGRTNTFDHLVDYLTGEPDRASYKQIAASLDMTEDAIKSAVYRLRRRYRELVRAEIAHTVANEKQIEDEINDLFSALAT